MQLAKPRLDVGLITSELPPMLAFWQGIAGVALDHVVPMGHGLDQHRHDVLGSVLKINHRMETLPANPPSGYRELLIAAKGLIAPRAMADPDGNRVSLVPPGLAGVTQIGVRIGVRDLAAHRRFYTEVLRLPEERPGAFRVGESLVLLEEDPSTTADAQIEGRGWRYITFQIFNVDEEHATILAAGGREAQAPFALGSAVRVSMVRDPDGNWIELSQRASIVGSLN